MLKPDGEEGRSRPSARVRAAAQREKQRQRERRQRALLAAGLVSVVIAIVAVMVVVYLTRGQPKVAASTPASPAVVAQVTTVPPAAFSRVDAARVARLPSKISGPALMFDGKPGVLYYGAEYCPFCAAERWPMVVALSRFGTWSALRQTVSGPAPEPFPLTPTFSFYGASFSSPYLTLQTVESRSNQKKNGEYAPLQRPTAAQDALLGQFGSGSIPFIDFGNRFLISGVTYSNDVLSGKSMDEIAAAVRDPSTPAGESVLGAANTITAAVCETTGGKPELVCNSPVISGLRKALESARS